MVEDASEGVVLLGEAKVVGEGMLLGPGVVGGQVVEFDQFCG